MEGYRQQQYGQTVKRYVQTLDLINDPEGIRAYRWLHSESVHWKEIRDGIRAVGILEMEVYIVSNRLVMIVETPADFDWDTAMARLATMPRQAEWEETVGKYQLSRPGATSNEKWTMMERIFHLYSDQDTAAQSVSSDDKTY